MNLKQQRSFTENTIRQNLLRHSSLAIIKGVVGVLGSTTLLVDSCRNGAEAIVSFINWYGVRGSNKATREDQAQLRVFSEATLTIVTIVLMFVFGLELGISALKAMMIGKPPVTTWVPVITIVLAYGVHVLLFPLKIQRAEFLPTLLVFTGTALSAIGSTFAIEPLMYVNPLCTVALVLLLLKYGYQLANNAVSRNIGVEEHPSDINEFKTAVQRIQGVVTVEDLSARELGHYVVADITISVNPRITVQEGHEIARRVKFFLMQRFGHITDVNVIVKPYDPRYPYKSNCDPNEEASPTLLQ